MSAIDVLRDKKKEVVRRWVEAIFASYPLETKGFLRTIQDPFANPVAHMTKEAGDILYDAMIGEETDTEKVKASLDRFIKFKAIQNVNPSESMAAFYMMKPVLRELVLPEMRSKGKMKYYLETESRLDTLVLLAFDMYIKARDTLSELRIKEIKSQYAQLAKWARNLENGVQEEKN